MEVILLEKVANLGSLGDKVKVKAGYGRNFLLPQGKAVPATADNVKAFEERRAELEKAAAERLAAAPFTLRDTLIQLERDFAEGSGTPSAAAEDQGLQQIASEPCH